MVIPYTAIGVVLIIGGLLILIIYLCLANYELKREMDAVKRHNDKMHEWIYHAQQERMQQRSQPEPLIDTETRIMTTREIAQEMGPEQLHTSRLRRPGQEQKGDPHMTTYHIKAKDPKHDILVGWDPPMNSFFLHVIDTSKSEDNPKRDVLWIGCTEHEIYNPDVVIEKAAPYAEIDPAMRDRLYKDAYDDKIGSKLDATAGDER